MVNKLALICLLQNFVFVPSVTIIKPIKLKHVSLKVQNVILKRTQNKVSIVFREKHKRNKIHKKGMINVAIKNTRGNQFATEVLVALINQRSNSIT